MQPDRPISKTPPADDPLCAILADSGALVAEWDIAQDRVTWLCRPDGLLPDDLAATARFEDLLSHVHPDDRAAFQKRVSDLLDQGDSYAGEVRIIGPGGEVRWLAERGRLLRGPDGRPVRLTILAMDVTPMRQAEERLEESRSRFRAMHDASPDAVILCSPAYGPGGRIEDFTYTYLNQAALGMAGRTAAEMMGRRMLEFFPENVEQGLHDRYVRAFETSLPDVLEFPYDSPRVKGWFRTTIVRVDNELAVTVADITERKETEAALRDALESQTMLMREMNHRVKNSLQMVASLVQLHRMRTRDPEARGVFDDVIARVRAVAEVHRLLYQGDRIGEVDLGSLLLPITEGVDDVTPDTITVTLPEEPLIVPVDQAIPVGLIANEMITNACKHAYGGGSGPIEVRLSRDADGMATLAVHDQGMGLPGGTDWQSQTSLGLMLLRSLTAQIDGTFDLDSGPTGTTASVSWRI